MASASSASSSLKGRALIQEPVDPTRGLRGTPIVLAAFRSGADFLHAYDDRGAGEIAVVTRARPRSNTPVVLEVTWPGLPNRVFLRARAFRRWLGLLARLHADEASARDFLVQMAAGDRVRYHLRAHRRYCVRISCEWRVFGGIAPVRGTVEDLSAGGLLVATATDPPAPGERVALRLRETGGQDLVLTGEVRHVRTRAADYAFGLEFPRGTSGEQRRLRHLLRAFAARGVVLLH